MGAILGGRWRSFWLIQRRDSFSRLCKLKHNYVLSELYGWGSLNRK